MVDRHGEYPRVRTVITNLFLSLSHPVGKITLIVLEALFKEAVVLVGVTASGFSLIRVEILAQSFVS